MNKKGFTLTEILAVLVILGVVMVIAIPSVTNLQDRFKTKYYEKLDDTVISASKTYFKDHEETIPKEEVGAAALSLSGLMKNKYLESIYPYNNKTDLCKGYVVLVKNGESNQYYSCMYCNVDGQTVYESSSMKNATTKNMCNLITNESEYFKDKDYVLINAKPVSVNNDVAYIYYETDPNYLKENLGFTSVYHLIEPDTGNVLLEVSSGKKIYPKSITNVSSGLSSRLPCTKDTCNSVTSPKLKYVDENERNYFLYKYPAPIVSGTIENKIEVGATIIKLTPPVIRFVDDGVEQGVYPRSDGTGKVKFKEFQYTVDGGYSWKNFCDTYECSRKLDTNLFNTGDKIKFRMVIQDDSGIHYSDETNDYTVKGASIVSFVTNCGSIAGTRTYTTTSAYGTLPTVTLIPGYTWVGWFDGNTKVGPTDTPSGEIVTLEGRCTPQAYSVSFNANGGTVTPTSKTVTYDQKYGDLPTPTYTKHTFKGWYTSASGGTKVTENTIVKTASNHTIYAHWEADPDKITLDANGGTIGGKTTKDINVYDGKQIGSLDRPYRSGYEFIGWFGSKSDADDPLKWYANKHGITGKNSYELYSDMITTGKQRSQFSATDIYHNSGDNKTPNVLYAGWYMSTIQVNGNNCINANISDGMYYIEIVGGGAGGHGVKGGGKGGTAARWAGYVKLNSGNYQICAGSGSKGEHGLLGSVPQNGNPSYIKLISSSSKLIESLGGRNYKQSYSSAVTNINTSSIIQCDNTIGHEISSVYSLAGLGRLAGYMNQKYGWGGKGGSTVEGYTDGGNGTSGVVFIRSESNTRQSTKSCPSKPICPTDGTTTVIGCGWTRNEWK